MDDDHFFVYMVVGRMRCLTGRKFSHVQLDRDAGVSEKIGCHTFRATGITNYLQNKGTLEFAHKLACH